MRHPAFDLKTPIPSTRSSADSAGVNPHHFHAAGGSGYAWAAEAISELQAMNSQVASRHARAALECIAAIDGLGE